MSELDKIKSTITISLGTKNRLRDLKKGMSYEEYINYLLRQISAENKDTNYLELQELKRKTGVYSFEDYKVVYSYNTYFKSANYQFDIVVDNVMENGKPIKFEKYVEALSKRTKKDIKETEYRAYFEILSNVIRVEIESMFKHNGRFEDHFSWKEEFKILALGDKSFEEDVMQKLNNYKQGLHVDD